jgi:outer membrane protein OmpA-like peptidoglycan-associated protein
MARVKKTASEESQWLSVSDLMSGLMIVFLFISIALMRTAYLERDKVVVEQKKLEELLRVYQENKDRVEGIVNAYQQNKTAVYDALKKEFADDLKKWDAEINPNDLTFTFKSPDILFATGKDQLTDKFKVVLDDFFPRYLKVLTTAGKTNEQGEFKAFRGSITEIRIEGHTDSTWGGAGLALTPKDIYYRNMELSQGRTRSVLTYVYDMPPIAIEREWMKKHIAAVGLSSSRPVYQEEACNKPDMARPDHCSEDLNGSRRVSFRILTNAEQEVQKILATFK